MKKPPIALQLYSLRDQLADNFKSVVRHVAEIGYDGVETAGIYGESPESAAKLFRELNLQISSSHIPLPLLENLETSIAVGHALGVKRVVCAWYPPERYATVQDVRGVCEELNRANRELRAQGFELDYHNHWQECATLDGKAVYQHMLDYLEPTIGFEIDVYWAKTAGLDPTAMVRELGKRAPLLHMKDGPATMDGAMTALGEGVMDLPPIAAASRGNAEWWVVELDRCDTNMVEAVEKSFTYLQKLQAG